MASKTLSQNYETALRLIDEAHAADPRTVPGDDGLVPYELHYARKMTRWLSVREPDASPELQLACRAQHFRRYVQPFYLNPPISCSSSALTLPSGP